MPPTGRYMYGVHRHSSQKTTRSFDAANTLVLIVHAGQPATSVTNELQASVCFQQAQRVSLVTLYLYLGTRDEAVQVDVEPLGALISGRSCTCRTTSPISATTGPHGGRKLSWDKIRRPTCNELQTLISLPFPNWKPLGHFNQHVPALDLAKQRSVQQRIRCD